MSSIELEAEVLGVRPMSQRFYQGEGGRYRLFPSIQTAAALKNLLSETMPKLEHAKARIAYDSCMAQVINVGFDDGYSMVKPEKANPEGSIVGIISLSDVIDHATENERLLAEEHLMVVYETSYDAGQLAIGNDGK